MSVQRTVTDLPAGLEQRQTFVEVDQNIGRKKGTAKRRGQGHRLAVLILVERAGEARSFHVDNAAYRQGRD